MNTPDTLLSHLQTILFEAKRNGTLDKLTKVGIYFSEEELRRIVNALTTSPSKAGEPQEWQPIETYKLDYGVVLLGLWVDVKHGKTVVREFQRYLGYMDDDDGSARDPEYNEPLPWDWNDFDSFIKIPKPSPPDTEALPSVEIYESPEKAGDE